jgi:biotin transporter BioY
MKNQIFENVYIGSLILVILSFIGSPIFAMDDSIVKIILTSTFGIFLFLLVSYFIGAVIKLIIGNNNEEDHGTPR